MKASSPPPPRRKEADKSFLVMEEGHPEDGANDPDRGGERMRGTIGEQEVHCGPFRVRRRASLLVLHFFGRGGFGTAVEETGLPCGVGELTYRGRWWIRRRRARGEAAGLDGLLESRTVFEVRQGALCCPSRGYVRVFRGLLGEADLGCPRS